MQDNKVHQAQLLLLKHSDLFDLTIAEQKLGWLENTDPTYFEEFTEIFGGEESEVKSRVKPLCSDHHMKNTQTGKKTEKEQLVPTNTDNNRKWATNNFEAWAK